MPIYEDLTVPPPPVGPNDWNDEGVVILKDFMPEALMQEYEACWLSHNVDRPGGWPPATPYMQHREIADFFCYGPLHTEMSNLLQGEALGLHLCLTGWVTTARNWHQDSYLNPPHVGDYYVACWIALETIHPDSGPFQYVPGSHRWPQVTREKIAPYVNLSDPDWPKHSEEVLTPFFEEEMERRNAKVVTYLPNRGDVLLWHGRLLHRGSPANVPGMQRKAAIAHFSGVKHRKDMPTPVFHGGGMIFPIGSKSW